ncbi:MAG: amidohydrolase family protein, partial [Tenericutes bacterium]|nr:amidohydrolase family protein [Mycoplasmatota bacterium]
TGVFTENALGLIYGVLPKPSKEDIKQYFIKANEILLSNGITSIGSDDFSTLNVDYELIIECLEELYENNLLQVRLYEQVNLPNKEILLDFINKGYVNKRFGNFRMGPLKILADGSLGGKTASLNEPYENEPSNYGIKTYSDEELFKLIYLADSNNMDVVIHAIGDDASDQAINALIKSLKLTKRKSHNHALIHAQLTTKIQIEKMKQWNIGAIIQPIFLNSDIQIIESRIGSRCFESYLFKTMFDSGIHVGFSTDSPIEPVNPFANIYSAVTRRSIKSPELDPFLIEESFTVENAILCYTYNNVRYTYENELNEKDYIITDTNIYSCPLEKIKDIKVLETYIDNKLIYKNKE